VLRSSGRLFWPVYYVLLLFLVFVVVRRFRSSVAITILAVALAVQVVDTSAGWLDIRRQRSSRHSVGYPTRGRLLG
jgi:integral membrane sensor domain MASE1